MKSRLTPRKAALGLTLALFLIKGNQANQRLVPVSGMLVSATPESRFLDARIFSKQRIDIQYDIGYYLCHQE